ncbi:MAG: hypothetical protein Q8P67_17455 [archaeon]|nr:hypothetical protein [archaeon]
MEESDAPFMLSMLLDPQWIHNIGDRGITTEEEAKEYEKKTSFN